MMSCCAVRRPKRNPLPVLLPPHAPGIEEEARRVARGTHAVRRLELRGPRRLLELVEEHNLADVRRIVYDERGAGQRLARGTVHELQKLAEKAAVREAFAVQARIGAWQVVLRRGRLGVRRDPSASVLQPVGRRERAEHHPSS